MGGVNPQGRIVPSFKAPTPMEKAHDFLWRIHAACPPHGYEDVLITRVHGRITDKEAHRRLGQILLDVFGDGSRSPPRRSPRWVPQRDVREVAGASRRPGYRPRGGSAGITVPGSRNRG